MSSRTTELILTSTFIVSLLTVLVFGYIEYKPVAERNLQALCAEPEFQAYCREQD